MKRTLLVLAVLFAVGCAAAGVGRASVPQSVIDAGASHAFAPFTADRAEMERAMRWGAQLAASGKSRGDLEEPWRIIIDKGGEFADNTHAG